MTMQSLQNHLIIAMPALGDPNFNQSVAYIFKHDDEGAIGLVINKPSEMTLGEVFAQLDLEIGDRAGAEHPVLRGGPVDPARGFVLHRGSGEYESTVDLDDGVQLTVSRDILFDMAGGRGPESAILVLGYAGWSPGQLESEIAANAWLVVESAPEILFDTDYDKRWEKAAHLIGVDIRSISSFTGHA